MATECTNDANRIDGGEPGPELSAEDLLAIVDHELGSLASVLIGLSSRLDRRWDELSGRERRDLSRRIAAQAASLATVLGNLRALRFGGGFGGETAGRSVDPHPSATLAAMVEDLRALAPDHEIVAEIADTPALRLDPSRVAQVMRNLVANAAKFAPPGSAIGISVGPDDRDGLLIRVTDAGPGIPSDQRERVFDKFVRLDPQRPGTGLGLFISKSIVEALGGRIWIEDGPAGGCAVSIQLPGIDQP